MKDSAGTRTALFTFLVSLLHFCAAQADQGVSLVADTNKPNTSTYVIGEPADVVILLNNWKPGSSSTLFVSILDEYGKSVTRPITTQLATDGFGSATFRLSVPTDRLGYFEIHAHLSDGTTLSSAGTRPAGFLTYAVVPDPAQRIDYGDAGSRFGMQGGFNANANVIHYLGVRYILQGEAGWASLEPNYAGEYHDKRMAAMKKGSVLPSFDATKKSPLLDGHVWKTYFLTTVTNASLPSWAMNKATAGTNCKSFGAVNSTSEQSLTNFAHEQAKGFHSDYASQRNRYYQVTWEPATGWCFGGSPSDLVHMYSLVYAAIHKEDPGAVVAGPTLFIDPVSTAQLHELWKAGLGNFVDAFSIHPYATAWPPETASGFLNTLRLQLGEAKAAIGHDVPFIATEHGYDSTQIGNLKKALGDIRTTIMMLGEGAKFDFGFYLADFWSGPDPLKSDGFGYYWNLNPGVKFGSDKIAPKIVVPAYAAMTYFLDGTASDGAVEGLSGSQVAYRFHRDDGSSILVIWDFSAPSSYAVAAGALVCDWMGKCSTRTTSSSVVGVGEAPTYVLSGPESSRLPTELKPSVRYQ